MFPTPPNANRLSTECLLRLLAPTVAKNPMMVIVMAMVALVMAAFVCLQLPTYPFSTQCPKIGHAIDCGLLALFDKTTTLWADCAKTKNRD